MTGATIPDQMNAPKLPERSQQLRQCPTQMFAVILIQTAASHLTVIHVEQRQKIDDPMPDVFKLLTFDLSWAHGLSGTCTFQRLKVRFLIQRQNDLVMFPEPIDPFI